MCSKLEQDTADPATRSCTPVSSLSKGGGHDQQRHCQVSHLMKVFFCIKLRLAAPCRPVSPGCQLLESRLGAACLSQRAAAGRGRHQGLRVFAGRAPAGHSNTQHSLSPAGLRPLQATAGLSPVQGGGSLSGWARTCATRSI